MKKRSDYVHCPIIHPSSLYSECLYKISKLLFALDIIIASATVVTTTIDRRPLAYDVSEELPPGAVVVADMARDAGLSFRYPDEVLRLISYSIIGQEQSQTGDYFRLNVDGQLVTAKTINREAICRQLWQCLVHLDVAVHPAKYFEIVKLELNVTDINDSPPVFTPNRLALSLLESTQPKELVSIIPAVDLDSPPNGVVGYRLQPSSERFALKVRNRTASAAGEADLRLVLLQPLDREKQDRFQMQVLAVDGGSPSLTGTLSVDVSVIDVNDNSPQFENASYSVEILENQPSGSTVLRVQARDPDSGLNGHVRYQFSRRSQVVSGDVFAIDSVSGAVVLLKPAKDLAQSVYSLAVIAEDQGENSVPSMTSVTITVNDVNEHRPVIFVDTHAGDGHQGWRGGDRPRTRARGGEDEPDEAEDVVDVEVAEHGSPNTSVVTVSVTDDDRGINGRVSCSLDGDSASFAIVQLFESEYKIVTTRSLEYDVQREHRLSIRCRDFGQPVPLSAIRNLTVTVTDASLDAPFFPVASYNASIRENNVPNEAILSVAANVRSKKNRTRIHYSLDHDAGGRRSERTPGNPVPVEW